MSKKEFNNIISLACNMADGRRKYVLFCGAGISKDAGIPTGWDILLETLKRIRAQEDGKNNEYSPEEMEKYYEDKYKGAEYSEIIKTLFPSMEEQREFLKELFKNKPVGQSHKLIAELINRKLIKYVITTNYDSMIEYALDEIGYKGGYTVISNNEQIKSSKPWIHEEICRIYKVHGTIEQGKIRNTEKDLIILDDYVVKDCLDILEKHGVIILGYAGNDKGIMDILGKRQFNGYTLYWTIHNNFLNESVKKILTAQDGVTININSASDFLEELINRIEIVNSEVEQTSEAVAEARFKNIMKSSQVEIMQTIDEERRKLRKFIESVLKEVNENDYKSLWEGYIKIYNYSKGFILLSEQIIKYSPLYWKNILPIYEDIYSLNKTNGRDGKDGLINYFFFTLLEVLGAILLQNNSFKQLREMLNSKWYNERRGRMENILDWNIQANFIENKKKDDTNSWICPRMEYLLQIIENNKTEISFDMRKRILEVDMLYFIYSVQYPSATISPHWYPQSAIYYDDMTPELIKRINLDNGYREQFGQEFLELNSKGFMELMKKAKELIKEYSTGGATIYSNKLFEGF